jgi:hypothetical protein
MRFPKLVVLLLALAACQPLPHPLAETAPPPDSPLMTPPDSVGVIVAPVTGAPSETAHDLADAMAIALQDDDVPASTNARNRGSYLLQGKATTADAGGGSLRVTVAWEMIGPDGATTGRQQATTTMAQSAWSDGGAGLANLVGPAAASLAKLIESTAPLPVPSTDPLIAVHAATGAPGDGGQALATAMSAALRRSQMALADFPGAAPSFIVEAAVAIAPAISGKQKVTIAWSLHRPDGAEVGQVKQENAVDAGSLDRVWGLTAFDAANAAAPGIAALVEEAKRAGSQPS